MQSTVLFSCKYGKLVPYDTHLHTHTCDRITSSIWSTYSFANNSLIIYRDFANARNEIEKRQREEAEQSNLEAQKKDVDEYAESATTNSANGVRWTNITKNVDQTMLVTC